MNKCDACHKEKVTVSAVVNGKYYPHICHACIGGTDISSGGASFDRRRDYEDNAQDTIQPYDAKGPNPEFARLYPKQAEHVYKPEVLAELRKQF